MITSRPCRNRRLAVYWTWQLQGLPASFQTVEEWSAWVKTVMNQSDLTEEWILSDGHLVGYMAYQKGFCIHHKGAALDLQMLVLEPGCKVTRQVWKKLKVVAKSKGYSWIARRKHQPDGSIKTIYTEV